MHHARSFGLERPRGARGLLPLLMGAYAVGKGLYGAVNANQTKQRNKGYIEDAYRGALQRQSVHDQDVRQGTAESLNARGLTAGAYDGGGGTLGSRAASDVERELGFEHHDLDAAHTRARNENQADYVNNLVGAATGTAEGIMSAYSAGQTMKATKALGGGAAASSVAAPRLVDSVPPGTQFHPASGEVMGAFGLHPTTAMPQTLSAYGQPNTDFHVGA